MLESSYPTDFEEQWREKFPLTLTKLFAFYEFLCALAILGCELGSVLIDHFNATIYVGMWSSIFFFIASILQFISVSYRYTYRYATYNLISQCIALFFAICVIGFDACFLIKPTTCFFSSILCNSSGSLRGVFYSTENFQDIKIPLIEGQLAIGVVMFAFCIDYIIIYVVIRIHLKKKLRLISKQKTTSISSKNNINDVNVPNTLESNSNEHIQSSAISVAFNSSSGDYVRHSRWSADSLTLPPVNEN